jgi:hypothetical protein
MNERLDGLTASNLFDFTNGVALMLDSAHATGCWWVGHCVCMVFEKLID